MFWNGHDTGMQLARHMYSGQAPITRRYAVDPSDTNKYFLGTPVKLTGDAFDNGVPVVTLADPGDAMLGAVTGWQYIPSKTGVDYIEGGAYLYVADDPDQIYVMTSSQVLNVADIGLNFDITAQSATRGRFSDVLIDATTATSAATGQLNVLRKVDAHWADLIDPSGTIEKTHYEVKVNRHQRRAGVAGV